MKQQLILSVLASLLFFNLAAGSFVRVINAVENSAPTDVWVVRGDMQTLGTQQNTPPIGRLFQSLKYAQIPPYFFLVDSTEPWTFVINTQMQGTNSSGLTLQQIQSLPSFTATLLPNASYSLIIANPVQQTSGQNFEYLLLRDAVVTESQGTSARLVNLIRSSAFLASDASQCADSLRASVGYLRSSEYIALPSTSLENLVVCVDGQASFAFPASSFHDDKRAHSVFIFHLNQRTQIEIESGFQAQLFDVILEPRAGCPGEEATVEPQLSNPRFIREIPTTGVAAPLLVDDQPIVVNNVFVRSIHASPELPPVDVFLDGQLWFSSLSYANVTDYKSTIRGIHNVTVVPSSTLTSEQMQKLNVTFPYTFLTFLAWDSYYTLAILPTQTSNAGELVGPLHRLFIDSLCQQNAESGAAFVQFYNLAMNMGSVRVTGQAQQGQLTVSPLEDTTYRAFPTSSISTIGISTTEQQLQIQGRDVESLQANTLYTTFIIQQGSGEVAILVKDREIRIICSIVDAKAILSQL